MLNISTVNNSEVTVYTVPTGSSAMVMVDIFPTTTDPNTIVKVNDVVYWSGEMKGFMSIKVSLAENDIVKVSTDGTVNVFVHGMVM